MSIMFFTACVVAASQRWRSTSTGTSTAWAAWITTRETTDQVLAFQSSQGGDPLPLTQFEKEPSRLAYSAWVCTHRQSLGYSIQGCMIATVAVCNRQASKQAECCDSGMCDNSMAVPPRFREEAGSRTDWTVHSQGTPPGDVVRASYRGAGNSDSRLVAAMAPARPPRLRAKQVAGLTRTMRSIRSGAASATRSARQPPNCGGVDVQSADSQ